MQRGRGKREGGAALIEAAIVLPIVFTLVMGLVECGLLFRDYLTLTNMTRSGARVISAQGSEADADYQALAASSSSGTAIPTASLRSIVIYKAEDASGPLTKMPESCESSSQSSVCNRYTADDLDRPKTDFGCGGCADRWYPATERRDTQSGEGPERVGVYVSMHHRFLSGMFGQGGMDMSDWTVMRIEPRKS